MAGTKATGRRGPHLKCDMCPEKTLTFFHHWQAATVTSLREYAKASGWRRDKLNRDVCPKHPKR